tara:strand:+ start:2521 stop:2844 length:324 start_codon:yes stop_codon:yes gene_type:complete
MFSNIFTALTPVVRPPFQVVWIFQAIMCFLEFEKRFANNNILPKPFLYEGLKFQHTAFNATHLYKTTPSYSLSVFSCYTDTAYCVIRLLTRKNIVQGEHENLWLYDP